VRVIVNDGLVGVEWTTFPMPAKAVFDKQTKVAHQKYGLS